MEILSGLAAAPAPPPTGPAVITPLQVALGAAVIVVNAIISISMSLGIEMQLLIGAVRWTVYKLACHYNFVLIIAALLNLLITFLT